MNRKILFIMLILLPLVLHAGEEHKKGSIILYDSLKSRPFRVNSDGGWMEVKAVMSEDFEGMEAPEQGWLRKWRVKTTYIDESRGNGESTLQVRIQGEGKENPVFTMPWTEKASRWQEKKSNWFIPWTNQEGLIEEKGKLAVRLIAPPHSGTPGKIYRIELEAWDFPMENAPGEKGRPRFHMALSPVSTPLLSQEKKPENHGQKEGQQAMNFALEFVKANMEGDLPVFYKALSENLHVLETGLVKSRYRVAPPARELEPFTMEDYKNNYTPHLYSKEEYEDLFPQWFDKEHSWVPDRDCYLFYGSECRQGGKDFMAEENLVFMVRKQGQSWKIIALPE